eukprot:3513926-Alexandrium_andersonii.AAC.1
MLLHTGAHAVGQAARNFRAAARATLGRGALGIEAGWTFRLALCHEPRLKCTAVHALRTWALPLHPWCML